MSLYTSKVIRIGDIMLGGDQPVRIQSMTNTNTLDTESTVRQIIRLVDAGCELVRITAQGIREAQNLAAIKKELQTRKYDVPLIADIHYNPKAAEVAASIVDKVRINPGNYINDHRKGLNRTIDHYSASDYNQELDEIKENLYPLIGICKSHGTAIRIGVNHGSLGNRVIQRYGDTVEGMVMSAVEYARICNELNFHNLVLSVKSSNTFIMAEAYRKLAMALMDEKLNYPLHLGVTEAGSGEDGRMKSYVGIGTVLSYGIGDTIRVSLTEDPENEIPVASDIVNRFTVSKHDMQERHIRGDLSLTSLLQRNVVNSTQGLKRTGGSSFALILKNGEKYLQWSDRDTFTLIDNTTIIEVFSKEDADKILAVEIPHYQSLLVKLAAHEAFGFISAFRRKGRLNPIFLMSLKKVDSLKEIKIENCIHPGGLILNGFVQGLCIDALNFNLKEVAEIGFNILQATRARITKTEYIACPSCGRTQFDIQKRLEEVKSATTHLKGLKIAVMGCIVNGPGEMADADYGYVGAGNGKVTLYKGKVVVRHAVPEQDAVKELLEIIESNKKDEL